MKQTGDKKTRDAFEPPIIQLLRQIEQLSIEKMNNIQRLEEKIKELRKLGTVNASLHYRTRRYLYLIHPTNSNGHRKREYVGAKPEKIKAAQEAVNRYHEAQELERRLSEEKRLMQQAEFYLGDAVKALKRKW